MLEKVILLNEKIMVKILDKKSSILNAKTFVLIFVFIFSFCINYYFILTHHGWSVDGYDDFAIELSYMIKNFKIEPEIFESYYASNRIIFPLLIAILLLFFPTRLAPWLGSLISSVSFVLFIFQIGAIMDDMKCTPNQIFLSRLLIITNTAIILSLGQVTTDWLGLFLFTVSLRFLNNEPRRFILAFLFLALATLTREIYLLGFLLFIPIFLQKSFKIRKGFWVLFVLTGISILIFFQQIILLFPVLQVALKHHIPSIVEGNYLEFFTIGLEKFENPNYVFGFLKGILKSGIGFTIFIILYTKFIEIESLIKYSHFSFSQKYDSIKIWTKRTQIYILWFFIYLFPLIFIYSNVTYTTGTRYLIPVLWIPAIFLSRSVRPPIMKRHYLPFIFLTLLGTGWAIGDRLESRYLYYGKGPVIKPGYEITFYSTKQIYKYNASIITPNIENRTILKLNFGEYTFSVYLDFRLWVNVSITKNISVTLWGTPDTDFRIYGYTPSNDRASLYGSTIWRARMGVTSRIPCPLNETTLTWSFLDSMDNASLPISIFRFRFRANVEDHIFIRNIKIW